MEDLRSVDLHDGAGDTCPPSCNNSAHDSFELVAPSVTGGEPQSCLNYMQHIVDFEIEAIPADTITERSLQGPVVVQEKDLVACDGIRACGIAQHRSYLWNIAYTSQSALIHRSRCSSLPLQSCIPAHSFFNTKVMSETQSLSPALR